MSTKECEFLVFDLETYYNMVVHERFDDGDCSVPCPPVDECIVNGTHRGPITYIPENIFMRSVSGPIQVNLTHLSFLHVANLGLSIDLDQLDVCIIRNLLCHACCEPNIFQVCVPFLGSGMMLPPGEYIIDIPDQQAPEYEPGSGYRDGRLTLIIETADAAQVTAAQFNQSRQIGQLVSHLVTHAGGIPEPESIWPRAMCCETEEDRR